TFLRRRWKWRGEQIVVRRARGQFRFGAVFDASDDAFGQPFPVGRGPLRRGPVAQHPVDGMRRPRRGSPTAAVRRGPALAHSLHVSSGPKPLFAMYSLSLRRASWMRHAIVPSGAPKIAAASSWDRPSMQTRTSVVRNVSES